MSRVRFDRDAIRAAYKETGTQEGARKKIGCGLSLVRRVLSGRDDAARESRDSKSRHVLPPIESKAASLPAISNPAFWEGRTIYPKTVIPAGPDEEPLKSGIHQPKIGGVIRKGRWAGFPVYQLSLEERKTCPTDCQLWRGCYGNKMHMAKRFAFGSGLEIALRAQVRRLAARHPGGFVVRLHVLGDFYSERYVDLWRVLLLLHPELHIWGYTRRVDPRRDPISHAVIRLIDRKWDRFAVRLSDGPVQEYSTVTIDHPLQCPPDAIVCPEQWTPSGKRAESCSTCGLCWTTTRRIAFIRH